MRKAKLAYVDGSVKPPRNMRRAQIKFGTADASKPMSPRSRRHEVINNAHTGPGVRNREKVPIPREAIQHYSRPKKRKFTAIIVNLGMMLHYNLAAYIMF